MSVGQTLGMVVYFSMSVGKFPIGLCLMPPSLSEDVGGWQAAEEIVVEATINNLNDIDLLVVPELNENQDIREKIVQLLRSKGYQVDDDNQPAPENIPNT